MRRRLTEFSAAFGTFQAIVEQHKPFYALEVYDSLVRILQLCHEEAVDYRYSDGHGREYWECQQKNLTAITAATDDCCDLIRSRIEKLAVLE